MDTVTSTGTKTDAVDKLATFHQLSVVIGGTNSSELYTCITRSIHMIIIRDKISVVFVYIQLVSFEIWYFQTRIYTSYNDTIDSKITTEMH
jgi:hypothetical protein